MCAPRDSHPAVAYLEGSCIPVLTLQARVRCTSLFERAQEGPRTAFLCALTNSGLTCSTSTHHYSMEEQAALTANAGVAVLGGAARSLPAPEDDGHAGQGAFARHHWLINILWCRRLHAWHISFVLLAMFQYLGVRSVDAHEEDKEEGKTRGRALYVAARATMSHRSIPRGVGALM